MFGFYALGFVLGFWVVGCYGFGIGFISVDGSL